MATAVKFEGITDELQEILDTNLDEAPARRRVREAFKEIQLGTARKLASSGYGVFAMDYPGFGLSDGLHGYIPKLDLLVDDVVEHFSKVKENQEYKSIPSFLFGQSMGGAVALKVHFKQPNAWDGAILSAPMCKIADNMVPHWLVTKLLIGIAKFFPRAKLVPHNNFGDLAFGDLKKREQNVTLPLLILQGEGDVVTDPSVSKALYEKASSRDKKILFYKDGCHALCEGDTDETISQVFVDVISWLDEHSMRNTPC
ncbi:hypothetical protein IFM89_038393 [Coptis chinensis]|uniref:Serine aminopeptidase S33 domain-containing protein n=1 Tax=Coptis chinensis TaxID=261450 RepID=A0A835LKM5_9MAGN|nr:hypothetical protein IFM89_038393 [Coptis chinensis]